MVDKGQLLRGQETAHMRLQVQVLFLTGDTYVCLSRGVGLLTTNDEPASVSATSSWLHDTCAFPIRHGLIRTPNRHIHTPIAGICEPPHKESSQ